MYEIREILRKELPRIDNGSRFGRVATEQELNNMGFFRILDTDYFDCTGVFDDNRGQYPIGHQLPGRHVTKGLDRFTKATQAVKDQISNVRVLRHQDPNQNLRRWADGKIEVARRIPDAVEIVVPPLEVQDGDIVVSYHPSKHFTGEV